MGEEEVDATIDEDVGTEEAVVGDDKTHKKQKQWEKNRFDSGKKSGGKKFGGKEEEEKLLEMLLARCQKSREELFLKLIKVQGNSGETQGKLKKSFLKPIKVQGKSGETQGKLNIVFPRNHS